MRFTDIHDADVRSGLLTVWRAAAEDPDSWAPDARPPSYVQEAHLRHALAATGSAADSPAWLGTAFELPGELDADALETALLGWNERHEALRSRLVPDGAHIRRETLRPGAVVVRRTEVGEFLHGDEVARRIEELYDRETDPLSWPSYVFATVSRPGSTTCYLGSDHSIVDGYSLLLVAYEIRELYTAAVLGGRAKLGEVGSYLDFAAAERREAGLVQDDHETVVRWRDFVAANGGRLPEFPVPVSDETGGGRDAVQPGGCVLLLDADGARAFDRVCRRSGGNIFAGILACLAKVGHDSAGHQEFHVLAPFHTRDESRWAQSVGWYVGMAPVFFAVHGADAFEKVLRDAMAALTGVKEMAEVPFARVMELLGVSLADPFMVSYLDMRRMPGAREWSDWNAGVLRSRSTDPNEVCLWINRSWDGVSLSFRHPATKIARTAVPGYIEYFGRLLEQIAAEGRWLEEVGTPDGLVHLARRV